MSLAGAVALVTGGSGGLGAEVSALLAEYGCSVAVTYRRGTDRAAESVAEITHMGGTAMAVPLDLRDPAGIEACVARVVAELGGLDLLINAAGMASGGHDIPKGSLAPFTPEIWDQMMAVNVRGPYLMARAAEPHLRASRLGRIVNVGSTIGHGTWGAGAAYAPSKAAVVPLTRYLAVALAPDVTVNCVAPGLMEDTQMSTGAPARYVDAWRNRSVLNRTTSLTDVARQIIAFCASETVTGQVVIVDGGIHFT
ncbi:MAG: SDR family oxidoreductase [Pseudomonadota bacterium]